MLKVSGIVKAYHQKTILNGVDLTARPGTCTGIVGSNGCGKTTLLSIIAGALRPGSGSVSINGTEAVGHPQVFAANVAYVPQENPLIEELSVLDNLSLWYRGSKKNLGRDLEQGAAAMLGVNQMLNRTVGKLSGGMKKRLSIACALANHASILVMDEPGAALDMECKAAIRTYLTDYIKAGNLVLLTSHELAELAVCTELYVLKAGVLQPIKKGLSEQELIRCF